MFANVDWSEVSASAAAIAACLAVAGLILTGIDFSRPGKAAFPAIIESFNGKLRGECLNQHWFHSLDDSQEVIEAWREDYNQRRTSVLRPSVPMSSTSRLKREFKLPTVVSTMHVVPQVRVNFINHKVSRSVEHQQIDSAWMNAARHSFKA